MKKNKDGTDVASKIKKHIQKPKLRHISLIYIAAVLILVGFRLLDNSSVSAYGCVVNGDITITANTTWSANQCYDNVTVTNSATLTLAGNTQHEMTSLTLGVGSAYGNIVVNGDVASGNGAEIKAGNVTIANGISGIRADGKGYGPGQGPGGSATGGASHGGASATGSAVVYGSAKQPTTLGSGSKYSSGGGAIKLVIDGNLANDGTISANGLSGSEGGSAGGSIWIEFTGSNSVWSGYNNITAYGGLEFADGGGGGRIAITGYKTDSHTGIMGAGGGGYSYHSWPIAGLPGTIFTKSADQTNGTLTINNGNAVPTTQRKTELDNSLLFDEWKIYSSVHPSQANDFTLPSGATMTLFNGASLDIDAGESFAVAAGGTLNTMSNASINNLSTGVFDVSALSEFTLTGKFNTDHAANNYFGDSTVIGVGGWVTHPANNDSKEHWLDLHFNNLTLSGGWINVNGKGYAPGQGPGGSSVGAASYGGAGGSGSEVVYGSAKDPTDLGSGSKDASGGGYIKLSIAGNLTNDGCIVADGNDDTSGGAGGTINIQFTGTDSDWSGSNCITAYGGLEYFDGGGGGRIAVTGYKTDSHTGHVVGASGGGYGYHSNPVAGLPGTVFTKSADQPNGTLYIDNNGGVPNSSRYTLLDAGQTYDTYIIRGYTRLVAPDGFSLPSVSTMLFSGAASLNILNGQSFSTQSGSTLTLGSTTAVNISDSASWVLNNGTNFNFDAGSLINNLGTGTFDTSGLTTLTINGTLNTSHDATNSFSDNVVVDYGGNITHPANADQKIYWLDLNFTNLTINFGGSIDVSGKGYAGGGIGGNGYGPGAGTGASGGDYGGGGGYGGAGGAGTGGSGGDTYGSKILPIDLGSGGGGGGNDGASGGGLLSLQVSGTLSVAGAIRADGLEGYGSGGGSGGSLRINVGTLDCTGGSISANGGYAGGYGGYGGGGRITYQQDVYTACSSMSVTGANLGTIVNIPNTPINLVLQSRTTTSLTWVFEDRSFSETEFMLYDGEGNYIDTQPSTTTVQQGSSYTFTEENIVPNTLLVRYVIAVNADAESSASTSATANTLAETPDEPDVDYYTNSILRVAINSANNSEQTTFAIRESSTSMYVQTNGTLGSVAVWRTYDGWGGATGVDVIGLNTNSIYDFSTKARSLDGVETQFSTASQKYTLAVVPTELTTSTITENSLRFIFGVGDNPPITEFAVTEQLSGLSLQQDGTLGQDPVWGIYSVWGGELGKLVTGLSEGTDYVFEVRARNGDGVETSTISLPATTIIPEEIIEPPEPKIPDEDKPKVQPPKVVPRVVSEDDDSASGTGEVASNNVKGIKATSVSEKPAKVGLLRGLANRLAVFFGVEPIAFARAFPWAVIGALFGLIVAVALNLIKQLIVVAKMKKLVRRQELLNLEKTWLLSLSSHYLRTPLTIIQSGQEMLRSGGYKESIVKGMSSLNSTVARIVDDLRNDNVVVEMKAPEQSSYRHSSLWQPKVVIPALIVLGLVAALNLLFTFGADLYPGSMNILSQILVVLAGAGLLYLAYDTWAEKQALGRYQHQLLVYAESLDRVRNKFVLSMAKELMPQIEKAKSFITPGMPLNARRNIEKGMSQLEATTEKFLLICQLEREELRRQAAEFGLKGTVEEAREQSKHPDSPLKLLLNEESTLNQPEVLLKKVFASLIDNAAEHGNSRKPVEIYSDEGKKVKISVQDFGKGIEKEKLSLLFKPLSKVEEDFTSQGMGLNLYLNRLIMHYLNGEISATSEVGIGTKMTVEIPKRLTF